MSNRYDEPQNDELKEFSVFRTKDEWSVRMFDVGAHAYRTPFQRDRDRILYSKEFRRLSGKTQVFVVSYDDNMRTRLTHSLEVAQIADTISRELGLNEYLTEAIALGHDVGHTPFGHVGERTLNYIMNGCYNLYGYNTNLDDSEKGFKHNLQGVKVVSRLEVLRNGEPGLNLTNFTMWGIQNHTSKNVKTCEYFEKEAGKCKYKNSNIDCKHGNMSVGYYDSINMRNKKKIVDDERDWSFEAIVVAVADEIAQRHHDIEDGIFARLIDPEELVSKIKEFFCMYPEVVEKVTYVEETIGLEVNTYFISNISKIIIDTYVTEFIGAAKKELMKIKEDYQIDSSEDFYNKRKKIYEFYVKGCKDITNSLHFSSRFSDVDSKFKGFLMSHILESELAHKMDGKASFIIRQLFKAYLTNPQQLPDDTIVKMVHELNGSEEIHGDFFKTKIASEARSILRNELKKGRTKTNKILLRTICDYIAGMTDLYAYKQYDILYGTDMMKKG